MIDAHDIHARQKVALGPLRAALDVGDAAAIRAALDRLIAPDAVLHLGHPFGDVQGPEALYDTALGPLRKALPDLERRDWIIMAGHDGDGAAWLGCGGHYMGAFNAPFCGIPHTGHLAHLRFHEFYRFEGGRVVEMQVLWDLPELMMQAGVWPMAPSLGRDICVPGPATCDGLSPAPRDAGLSTANCDLVQDMLAHMIRHPAQGGPEVMQMDRFWHPKMNWYGPAGIGTARGIAGFRAWHQTPFLQAMPDRGQNADGLDMHVFADNGYVAVTGWPNMRQTITGDGWLGIAPAGQLVTLRSLDFWRIEAGKIRENWVLIDLLDVFRQLGVDVLARMRALAAARSPMQAERV